MDRISDEASLSENSFLELFVLSESFLIRDLKRFVCFVRTYLEVVLVVVVIVVVVVVVLLVIVVVGVVPAEAGDSLPEPQDCLLRLKRGCFVTGSSSLSLLHWQETPL